MTELFKIAHEMGGGVLYRQDLLHLGVSRREIDRSVARGHLVSLRPGAFVPAATAADADAHHRAFVIASARLGARRHPVSHWSAAALHGLPLIGEWPRTLHVTHADARGGSSSPLVTRHRGGRAPITIEIDGTLTTTVTRTVVDVARSSTFVAAVAVVDRALSTAPPGFGLVREALLDELHSCGLTNGIARAERAILFGDGRAGSTGESLSRARMHQLGFAIPDLQVHFTCTMGLDRWVDFFWRAVRKIGEFDGKEKFTNTAYTGGRPAADVAWEEKRREDALRPLVASFDRWDWSIAISPRRFQRFLRDRGVPSDTHRHR